LASYINNNYNSYAAGDAAQISVTAYFHQHFANSKSTWGLLTVLELKHFQTPLKLNSKTFKHQICFQGLSRALKNGKTFKNFQGRVVTMTIYRQNKIAILTSQVN